MRLNTVPARQGFIWVRRGFQGFLQRPMAHTLLLASFLFTAMVMMMLPMLGVVLLLMSLPLVSLGFMEATRRGLMGQSATPAVFFEGLRGPAPQRKAMLSLMAVYAVANIAVILLADAVDAGRFEALQQAMTAEKEADPQALALMLSDPRLLWAMVLRLGLTSLVSLPFWHAPALIHWAGQGLGQSLFISSLACWRNKGALTIYALGWLALVMLFSVLANTLVTLLGEPRLLALAAMPAGLMFSTAFYVSLYFIYTDCFLPEPRAVAPPAPGTDSDALPPAAP